MRAAALIVLAACGGGMHPVGSRDEVAQRIVSADAAGLAAMLRPGLGYGGLWFEDPACLQQFIAAGVVGSDRIAAFASCIAGLHLHATERSHPYDDVIELEYAPGFEVEAQFDDAGAIKWIGYAGRHDLRDALPAITPAALEGLRTAGSSSPDLDDAARARLRGERTELGVHSSYAWLKVCLDADGKVTSAKPRQESSPIAADVLSTAALRWAFRPFIVGGHPLPVCALVYLAEQRDEEAAHLLPEPVPPELGSVIVGSGAIHRISGQTMILPSESEQQEIMQLHLGRVIMAFAYCVDVNGDVAGIRQTRRSGLESYDQRVAGVILSWKFRPLVVEGQALAACSSIKFIYSQR